MSNIVDTRIDRCIDLGNAHPCVRFVGHQRDVSRSPTHRPLASGTEANPNVFGAIQQAPVPYSRFEFISVRQIAVTAAGETDPSKAVLRVTVFASS